MNSRGAHIPGLFTDLYELSMAQAYTAEGMDKTAVFELTSRKLPSCRNYLIAGGITDAVDYLAGFRFSSDELQWLGRRREFSSEFLASLGKVRFSGDVYAVPEGTPVFPHEPLLQVCAPILEAQLVETALLNLIHFQTSVLTKATRVVAAAQGRQVVEFGSRRAPGRDAALSVARAVYMAGGAGTSNTLAGQLFGIPVFGTMAHSYIQAHETEGEAFRAFAALYPESTILVDTYDTLDGVRLVIDLARRAGSGFAASAIRLDSGDLASLARESRRILDEAGFDNIRIFASSGLDEYQIARLMAGGAPIDAFGVGTKLAVCADAPDLDMAYKLVEYAGRGRCKLSAEKTVYPGRKQVFRRIRDSRLAGDTIGRADEQLPGVPLLIPLMLKGVPQSAATLEESRSRLREQMALLPENLRSLDERGETYPVDFSQTLQQGLDHLRETTIRQTAKC
jgi:nicotinate phosphoribosyltransferase